jgi:hypothetical protein
VNPVELYDQVSNQSAKLKAFYILLKDGAVKRIEKSNLQKEKASILNKLVLETEYHVFYKHLLWDEFNSLIASSDTRLSYSNLTKRIEQNFLSALVNTETYVIKIPFEINHNEFLKQMSAIINTDSDD